MLTIKITLLLLFLIITLSRGSPLPKHYHISRDAYYSPDPEYYDPHPDPDADPDSSQLRGGSRLPRSSPHPHHSLPPSSSSLLLNHSQTQTHQSIHSPSTAPPSQPHPHGMSPNLAPIPSNLPQKSSRLLTRHPRHAKSLLTSLTKKLKWFSSPKKKSHPHKSQNLVQRPLSYSHVHINNPLSPPLPGADVPTEGEVETSGFLAQDQFFPNGDRYQGIYDSQGDVRGGGGGGGRSGWIPLEQLEGGGWNPLVRVQPIPSTYQQTGNRVTAGDQGQRQRTVGVETVPPLWNGQQTQERPRPVQNSYNPSKTRVATKYSTSQLDQDPPRPPVGDTVNLDEVVYYDEVYPVEENTEVGKEKDEQIVIDYVTYYDEIVEDQDKPSSVKFEDEPVYASSSRLAPNKIKLEPLQSQNQGRTMFTPNVGTWSKPSRFTIADANEWGKASTSTTTTTTTPQPIFVQQFRSTTRRPIRRPPLVYRTTTPKPRVSTPITKNYEEDSGILQSSSKPQTSKKGSTKFYYAIKKNPEDWETWAEDIFSPSS